VLDVLKLNSTALAVTWRIAGI